MQLERKLREKLDSDLRGVMEDPSFHDADAFPAVFHTDRESVDKLVQLVRQEGGEIRHVIRILPAVSARISKRGLRNLIGRSIVHSVELAQPIDMAV